MEGEDLEIVKKPRLHNKSNLSTLSLLHYGDQELTESFERMKLSLEKVEDPLFLHFNSPCFLLKNKQGRWTDKVLKPSTRVGGETDQLCFGYQLSAFVSFGRNQLEGVSTNKTRDCLTISHLCLVKFCCTPGHTILESKYINDERTHCQWSMKNILKKQGVEGIVKFWELGACPHNPVCGKLNK